jgi:hypothetical protein
MVAVVMPVGVWRNERGPREATAPGGASAPADGAQLCVRPQLPLERQADADEVELLEHGVLLALAPRGRREGVPGNAWP